MSAMSLGKRFLETTRGQVVALVRMGTRSVEELAQAIGLTDNAIRAHLSTLERDGLIRQAGVRRGQGAGKPATIYEVHPEAEPLFSRAYAPVLAALLEELAVHHPAALGESLMEGVGRRLADGVGRAPSGDLGSRVEAGAALLRSLGGAAQAEERDGLHLIRSCGGCPLSAATAHRPELCRALQSLLSHYIGAPVREQCDRGERPRCHFEVREAA